MTSPQSVPHSAQFSPERPDVPQLPHACLFPGPGRGHRSPCELHPQYYYYRLVLPCGPQLQGSAPGLRQQEQHHGPCQGSGLPDPQGEAVLRRLTQVQTALGLQVVVLLPGHQSASSGGSKSTGDQLEMGSKLGEGLLWSNPDAAGIARRPVMSIHPAPLLPP